jgi:parallel beta-helix repeat protein
LHPDAIQGWTAKDVTNRNVVIDANFIMNTPSYGDYMQGISIFDGKWDGLVVSNNVVIDNAWHGIALYGVANALVVNNTVVPSGPEKITTWITIHDSKDKTPSRNVIVRNNISAELAISGDNVTMDHNLVEKLISMPETGKVKYYNKGAVGDHNVVRPYIYLSLTEVDNASGNYDLRPKADSPATGAGNSDGAPPVDITGKPRTSPIDIGAYAR